MNIVQFLKIKFHFKQFCKFPQDEPSIEHTELTGTHSEKEAGFQLTENPGTLA